MADFPKTVIAKVTPGFMTGDSPVTFVQEPPRLRTIFHNDRICRVALPWISIGTLYGPGPYFPNALLPRYIFAIAHHRPWTSEQDFINDIPFYRIMTGDNISAMQKVCVGADAEDKLWKGDITPAEAFWMTEFELVPRISGVPIDIPRLPFIRPKSKFSASA